MKLRITSVLTHGFAPLAAACVAALCFPAQASAAFLVVLTIVMFATGAGAEYFAALVFYTLAMLLNVAPASAVFSGFESAAFWLILAGFFLGDAITKTGLGERIAGYVTRFVPDGYAWAITGTAALSLIMAFIMPSAMGRVLLMLPVMGDMARKLGYEDESNAHQGIVLTGLFSTFMPSIAILPANIQNMVLVGSAESAGIKAPDYMQYLLMNFPALGLLEAVAIAVITFLMFRPSREEDAAAVTRRHAAKRTARIWSGGEIRLGFILGFCLILWCTDSLHHISPAWVGMTGAILCVMPGIGMLDPQKAIRELNFSSLLYISSLIGVGAVVSYSGLGEKLADALLRVLPFADAHPMWNFSVLGILSTLLGVITTPPGVPPVLTPLAAHLAAASGFTPFAAMMTQVLGFAAVMFPYQTGPLLVGLGMMKFPIGRATRILLMLVVVDILLLWPVEYFVWRLMGII